MEEHLITPMNLNGVKEGFNVVLITVFVELPTPFLEVDRSLWKSATRINRFVDLATLTTAVHAPCSIQVTFHFTHTITSKLRNFQIVP
jgi:hypothetical protein